MMNTTGSDGDVFGKELKKGPWSTAEDAILTEWVAKHGEGKWNDLHRKAGLMRCGKSCRLRWLNHLRSNLIKGAFTPEEENKILRLHARFGNKWSLIALHLPGRTDNEIKNYWNTRFKRHLRARLPIYPEGVVPHNQRHLQLQRPSSSSSSTSLSQTNTTSIPTSSSPSQMVNASFTSSSPSQMVNASFTSSSPSQMVNANLTCSSPPQMVNANFTCSSPVPSAQMANANFSSIPTPSSPSQMPNANYNFSSIPNTSLMDPILSSPLYYPDSMPDFNLHTDYNAPALSPPPSQDPLFPTSPSIPLFDDLPSIQSSFQPLTPTSSSHIGGEDRNNGLLEDIVGQSLSSRLPPVEEHQKKDDQSDAIAITNVQHHNNVNLAPVTPTDIGVREDQLLDMMNDEFWSFIDLPPHELIDQGMSDAANGFNAATENVQGEAASSPVPTSAETLVVFPVTETSQDQDEPNYEWASSPPIAFSPIDTDDHDQEWAGYMLPHVSTA